MIIVLMPSEEPEDIAAERFAAFASVVHSRTPENHSIDLRAPWMPHGRAFCGEHGRIVPTSQDLCPKCAGSVTSAKEVDAARERFARARRLGFDASAEADAKRTATLSRHASHHIVVG